jgi:fatty acid desaturase
MRRYSLLFTVNGAAFAIVTFASEAISDAAGGSARWSVTLPGELQLTHLAAGAILFTFLMFLDIWAWGWQMRQTVVPHSFTILGRCVLAGMSALIICEWTFGAGWIRPPTLQLLFAGATFLVLLVVGHAAGACLDRGRRRRDRALQVRSGREAVPHPAIAKSGER